MLASSSSFLTSIAQLVPGAAGGEAAAASAEPAPGFAELLTGLSQAAGKGPRSPDGGAEQGLKAEMPALATILELAAGLAQAALGAQPATDSGKDLPVGLPGAAEASDETRTEAAPDASAVALAGNLLALLAAPASVAPEPVPGAAGPRARRAPAAAPRPVSPAAQALAAAASKLKPDAQKSDGSQVPAVPISVASQGGQTPPATPGTGPEPMAPARAKAARTVDPLRVDAPLPQLSSSGSSAAVADLPAPAAGVHAANGPVHTPAHPSAAADIDAALDRLVAAREALMPAAAALAIDHAEFGEVSIRFDQAPDGRLSAELAGADPELQRAVTAAVAADRGTAPGSDGDSGRPAQLANHRGSAAGGDAAQGERSQPGSERDTTQRRGANRSAARQSPADPHPGVFA